MFSFAEEEWGLRFWIAYRGFGYGVNAYKRSLVLL